MMNPPRKWGVYSFGDIYNKSNNMKSPISFEQFTSNPIGAVAFISVLAVGFLFYELRESYNEQLLNQEERIEKLEGKLETYEVKLDELNQKLLECLRVNNR